MYCKKWDCQGVLKVTTLAIFPMDLTETLQGLRLIEQQEKQGQILGPTIKAEKLGESVATHKTIVSGNPQLDMEEVEFYDAQECLSDEFVQRVEESSVGSHASMNTKEVEHCVVM